mmetsp:Transcript_24033/g.65020  ORF Transcript_24033/g.65020 Transcript_24033/m.65020 type:complete len:203 (+) Transcript_24033:791-1399(+)
MCDEPVPKDSSPQMKGVYCSQSIRLPKNFQPVGVSKKEKSRASATTSRAPEVGIERATPLIPPANCGIAALPFAARMATESEGVTKKPLPRIMLRSASPSAAAPKSGADAAAAVCIPPPSSPMTLTSSWAYARLGSGWPPPKSSLGTQFMSESNGTPRASPRIRFAEGPAAPCMASKTILKSGRDTRAFRAGKSKQASRTAK